MLRYRDGKFDDYSDRFDITEIAVTWMFRAADGGRTMFATILNSMVADEHGKFSSGRGCPSSSELSRDINGPGS